MGQTEQTALEMLEEMADRLLTASTDGELITDPDAFELNEELRLIIDKLREEQAAPVAASPDVPHGYEGIEIGLDKCKRCGKSRDAHVAGTGKICRCDCVNCVTGNHHQCYYRPEPICCTLDAPVAASPSAGAQHHVFCNFQNQPIGGPGCICIVTYKKHIEDLENALRQCNHLQHQMAIELNAIPQQPRLEYWTRAIEKVVCDALGTKARPAASPSAGEEKEHVVSHYEPWGVMPANKLSATSLSAGDSESYTGPKGSLAKINWQKIAEDRAVEIASLRAVASPDVLARIEGLIEKWRSVEGGVFMSAKHQRSLECADELAALSAKEQK